MKEEKVMLIGATIIGTIGAMLVLKKLLSKKEHDRYKDDDFDENSHVVKRFCVTDEETKRFFDEIFGDNTEDEDE